MEDIETVTFKGMRSDYFDLRILSFGRRQRGQEVIEIYEIPNGDDLTIHTGLYKPYMREISFATNSKQLTQDILKWLTGRGELRTSVDANGYFMASVAGEVKVSKYSKNFDSFSVNFRVEPYFYLDAPNIVLTEAKTIINPGTHHAEPLIKVNGSGDITLSINSMSVSLSNVDGYIYLDSQLKSCYKTANEGNKMVGEFPLLGVGANSISWTGSLTSIEIVPRWREL